MFTEHDVAFFIAQDWDAAKSLPDAGVIRMERSGQNIHLYVDARGEPTREFVIGVNEVRVVRQNA